MNNIEYINGALRTEAPVTDELLARLLDPASLIYLNHLFSMIITTNQQLDQLKKWIFYGKPFAIAAGNVNFPSIVPTRARAMVRLIHSIMGMNTEAAEMAEALHSYIFKEGAFDSLNLIEESGDQFWYLAIFADAMAVTFENIMDRNNRKLRTRYPEKFNETEAMKRDLEAEKVSLLADKIEEGISLVVPATQDSPAIYKTPTGKLVAGKSVAGQLGHFGDPCIYCGIPHDNVPIGPCRKHPFSHPFTSDERRPLCCVECSQWEEAHHPKGELQLADPLASQLCKLLMPFAGGAGNSEGATEVLERLIQERRTLLQYVSASTTRFDEWRR